MRTEFRRYSISSSKEEERMSRSKFAVIILAGGLSTRFPGNKMLHLVGGKPLIVHTVEKFISAGMDKIVVVFGKDAPRVFEALASEISGEELSKLFFTFNLNYAAGGMSSSIKTGMKIVLPDENVVIHPADVPFLKPSSIEKVVQSHVSSDLPITVACYNGRHAHPILFKPEMREELMGITEEGRGLKSIVGKYRDKILCVETGDPGTLRDIDTPEDLESALKSFGSEMGQ
jgi:molybdenum cofactor cytidylyltransferase